MEKKQKKGQMGPYTYAERNDGHTHTKRGRRRAPQLVSLVVGFSAALLVFFLKDVTKCRYSHLITRNLFIDGDAGARKQLTYLTREYFRGTRKKPSKYIKAPSTEPAPGKTHTVVFGTDFQARDFG